MIIQGLGGRNKVDAPTATWEASQAFLDRATAAGAPVYSMLIARPFDRPVVDRRDQLPLPRRPVLGRHAEAPGHADRIRALQDPAARDELRDAVEHYNRDPSQGTTVPPPLWDAVFVDEVTQPEHSRCRAARSRSSPTSRAWRPADVLLDLALAEDLATRFRWRTESPEWAAAVGEAQLDARMLVGTSDGGAHLARDDGADWSSYFLRSWVLDRHVWTLEDGIRQITQVPAAALGLTDRGVHAPRRLGRPHGLRPRHDRPVAQGVRRTTCPAGSAGSRRGARACTATVVNGIPIVRDGTLTGALPGQVVRPGAP